MGNKSSSNSTSGSGKMLKVQGPITTLLPSPRIIRSLTYEVDQGSPLHMLPEEIFSKIIRFVPAMDLICNGRLVCKFWLDIIDDDMLWRKKCLEDRIPFPQVQHSHNSESPFVLDYRLIYLKRPFHRNLVKNWNAADGFEHWTITENGGNLFAIEPNDCHYSNPVSSINVPGCSNCWATSYGWCKKTQTIDLLEEGCSREILDTMKPTIEISEWTAARYDCSSQYLLHVKLLAESGKVIDVFESERYVGQWEDKSWIKVSHKFCNYQPGVRYVSILHGGKDRQFWAGHYGPKITASSVIISLENCRLCHGQNQ